MRMDVPAGVLLDASRCRLWFGDFYCNHSNHPTPNHYVTIVITVRRMRAVE
jgi:hypothetical protein